MNKRKLDADMKDRIPIAKQAKILNDKIIEDGRVKFEFMISLQNIAITKVVNTLWMNQSTQQDIMNFIHTSMRPWVRETDTWREVENNVLTKVSELLPLPKYIAKELTTVVPLAGTSIFDWIGYHDEHILNTRVYSEFSAVDLIGNITWTARGKIDYGQTAKNILAREDSCLSADNKYKLACTYCLEDEIEVLAPNVVNKNYLDSVDITVHPMVYFWTAHITGDNTKLRNLSYYDYANRCNINMSINEHIIQLLMKNDGWFERTLNNVPIRYMWDKLSEKEKAENILPLVEELGNQESRYSLLSSLNYDEQKDVFKEFSGTILVDMLNDWLWRDYLLQTALRLLNFMDPISYVYLLQEINKEKNKNAQDGNKHWYDKCKIMLKTLWQEGSKDLKEFIFQHEDGKYCGEIVTALSWERDMDIIGVICKDLNAQQKKKLIFGFEGVRQCADCIKKDQWDLVNLFINYTLSSERDIIQLKQILVTDRGEDIALHFLDQKALDKMEYFMRWIYKSEENKIDEFRKRFAYTKIYDDTLESIIKNNKADFTDLENYFTWCAKGDIEIIKQFKNDFLKLQSSFTAIEVLISSGQFEVLDKVLNWCFSANQQQIAQYKCNMYKNIIFRSTIFILIEKNDSLKLLDKFIHWCFTNQQEIRDFKTWILYPEEGERGILEDILCHHQLELADKFIKWSGISPETVNVFKTSLMLSIDMKRVIHHETHWNRKSDFLSLIKWFNPSKEIVQKLKQKLISEEKDSYHCNEWLADKMFCKLLDEYIESQNV